MDWGMCNRATESQTIGLCFSREILLTENMKRKNSRGETMTSSAEQTNRPVTVWRQELRRGHWDGDRAISPTCCSASSAAPSISLQPRLSATTADLLFFFFSSRNSLVEMFFWSKSLYSNVFRLRRDMQKEPFYKNRRQHESADSDN